MARNQALRDLNSIEWTDEYVSLLAKMLLEGKRNELKQKNNTLSKYIDNIFPVNNDAFDSSKLGLRFIVNPGSESENSWYIVPHSKRDSALSKLYKDPDTTANSRDGLYSHVSQYFIGISRRYVQDWLKKQESYQIHLAAPTPKNVGVIVTKKPNQLWFIDITYIGKKFSDGPYQYLLCIVDHFTKYAWTAALTNIKAATVSKKLQQIMEEPDHENNPAAGYPQRIQTDRGMEFTSDFTKMLQLKGIEHSLSYAYTPQAQGTVESFNKTIKKKIFSYLTIQNTKKWAQVLPALTSNYNRTKHSRTKYTPIELYFEKSNNLQWSLSDEGGSIINKRLQVHQRLVAKKTKVENRMNPSTSPEQELNVGDYVRISKWAWNPDNDPKKDENFVRARKSGIKGKKYHANWTRAVFVVAKKMKNQNQQEVFVLSTLGSQPVLLQARKFYRADLLKIMKIPVMNAQGSVVKTEKYDITDMKKFEDNEEPKQEEKKAISTEPKLTPIVQKQTTAASNNPTFPQYAHLEGKHLWKNGEYEGIILNIRTRKRNCRKGENCKGQRSEVVAVIQTSSSSQNKLVTINALRQKARFKYEITNTKNLGDIFEGPITKQQQ